MTWKGRVIDCFKNQRKRKLRDVPEVAEQIQRKKQKVDHSSGSAAATFAAPACSNVWGLVNFKPERLPGEDDYSVENALKVLHRQGQLAAHLRDQAKVDFHMDRTFADRREAIIVQGVDAKTLLDQYPDLRSEEGVSLID